MNLSRIFKSNYTYSIWWNCLLLTLGSVLFSLGVKGIVVHHGFITGGLFGLSILVSYATNMLSPDLWFAALSLPLFVLGWIFVSRRFFWYSVFATAMIMLSYNLIQVNFHIHDQLYAAVAAGVICGAGGGVMLRSLGSAGGLDVLAVILFSRLNFGVGKTYLVFNSLLFGLTLFKMPVDTVIASLMLVFISSTSLDYVLSMSSQRKIVFIISRNPQEIADAILKRLKIGATFIKGRGAFSGADRDILMTVINNIQLKRLEEIVFSRDEQALFIVENTFNVLGSTFSKRKIY